MLRKIGLVLALLGWVTVAQAQKSLGDLAADAGLDWLAGQWQAVSDRGDALSISFTPDLDKNIALVHYKDQNTESKGIVVVDPSTSEPRYYCGNNQGGYGTGVWSLEDKKAVLKYKHTAADGKVTRMGFTFAKVDAETMELKILELSDQDTLGTEPRWTAKFKRKK